LKAADLSRSRRRALLEEATVANDQLLVRLDDTLSRIHAFRDERAEVAIRLRALRDELEDGAGERREVLPAPG
jgi:uncharacterized coiled-coil DUF342 family protein